MQLRTPKLGVLFAASAALWLSACRNDPWTDAGEEAQAQAQSAILADQDPLRIVHFADSLLDLDSAAMLVKLEDMAPRHPLIFEPNWRENLPPYLLDQGLRQLWADAKKVRKPLADFDRRTKQMLDRIDGLQAAPSGLRVYTYISRAEEFDVLKTEGALFVAWDRFLGSEHPLYANESAYLRKRHDPERIYGSMAAALYEPTPSGGGQLLDEMLRRGKQLLFIQTVLGEEDAYLYLTYSADQQAFLAENEAALWKSLARERWLFDNRADLKRKLVEVAPFSKMGSERDQEIPGQIGVWFGWRIMQAYWRSNPQLSLWEVLEASPKSTEILKQSNYRP